MDELWNRAQLSLEAMLGSNYNIWIKPMTSAESGEDWITLITPNGHFAEFVEKYYQPHIEQVLLELTGNPYEIRYSYGNEPVQLPTKERERPPSKTPGIPPEKNFNNFVVGACNQIAHAAAFAVAELPGDPQCNPLFIYGSTGLGKTHLLQSIGNKIAKERPESQVLYVTAEQFTNELINAFRWRRTHEFQQKYRVNCQILLMDDIQFFSGKERTQEELFHTFEWLRDRGRQIVFTADVLPRNISGFAPRLQSRCASGMLADTQPPDMETMLAILRQKSESMDLILADDTAQYISSGVAGNIRELEGVLNRLKVLCRLKGAPPTLDFARKELGELLYFERPKVVAEDIMQLVSSAFSIKHSDMLGKSRKKHLVRPRHIAMWLTRKHTELSFIDIGRSFGGRDHASIQYACNKIQKQQKSDPDLRSTIRLIERNLGIAGEVDEDL
jgi:chromosomal replication initiator protein